MKTYTVLFLIFSFIFCSSAMAQTDLTGTWEGKLAIDQNNKLNISFIFTKQADGSYKVVLDSPDTGAIKNVVASSVKYTDGKLAIEVASLSGSYSGTVGKGVITGEWKQQDSSLPLVLTPYKKPEVVTLKPWVGKWEGMLQVPGSGELRIIFRFEINKDGVLITFMDVPQQGAMGIPANIVNLAGAQLTLKFLGGQIEYLGKLSGNNIDGTFKQNGLEFKLDMMKGQYQPPPIVMAAEDMNQLLGKWLGRMEIPGDVIYTMVFRFEKTKDGKLAAFNDCPERGQYGNRLSDVLIKGDQFSFKIPIVNGEYTGKLDNNSMVGTYKVGAKQYTLNVTRGAKYEAQVAQIDIPAEAMKQLLGRWKAKLGNVSVIFRFEQDPGGKSVILLDSPEQEAKGIPVLKASMTDGNLLLKIAGSEYNGKLNGTKIDGTLKILEQGITLPLPLTKE